MANGTRQEQIRNVIRERILSGVWTPGVKIPTERDLQVEHKVSRPTISKALSQLVTEGLLVRQQGRGTFVRSLAETRNHVRVITYTMSHLSQAIFVGLEQGLRENGFSLSLSFLTEAATDESAFAPGAHDAGLVAIGPIPPRFLQAFQDQDLPVVRVDTDAASHVFDCVRIDNEGESYRAVKALIAAGHKRIIFVGMCDGDLKEWPNTTARRRGFERAMQEARLSVRPDDVFSVYETSTNESVIQRLVAMESAPDGAFICSPNILMSILVARIRGGLRLPRHFCGVSFGCPAGADEIAKGGFARFLIVDFKYMGFAAARLLRERLDQPNLPVRDMVLLAKGWDVE